MVKSPEKRVFLINNRFLKEIWSNALIEIIDETILHVKDHRLQNFTGAMLKHQSLQATKFMSKWIEEKNKG